MSIALTTIITLGAVAQPAQGPSSTAVAIDAQLKAAGEALGRGDERGAETALEKVLAADADHVDALWAVALLAHKRAGFAHAVRTLEHLLSLDPYNDEARSLLAQASSNLAQETLRQLGRRHPERGGGPEGPDVDAAEGPTSGWRPFARGDITLGYNTNLTLSRSDVLQRARQGSAMLYLGVVGGILSPGSPRAITAFAHFTSQQPLQRRARTLAFAPSSYGATLVARRTLGRVEGAVDLRFRETRTGVFAGGDVDPATLYSERRMAPTVQFTYPLGPTHRPSLALGATFISPEGGDLLSGANIHLRESVNIGRISVVAQAGMALRGGGRATVIDLAPFTELNGLIHVAHLVDSLGLRLFVSAVGRFRRYQDFPARETLWSGLAGAQYKFDAWEVHAEYGLLNNRGGSGRTFTQHQVGLGLRYWVD